MSIKERMEIMYAKNTWEKYKDQLNEVFDYNEDYKHYIIAYKAENGEIKDIKLRFLDKDFNIVDEASLMQYIKPDFARLTDIGPSEDTDEDVKPDKKGLVAIKSGIKPKLREIEKKA